MKTGGKGSIFVLTLHLTGWGSADSTFTLGDVTFEIEKGSSVLAERLAHMSTRVSVNPGICGHLEPRTTPPLQASPILIHHYQHGKSQPVSPQSQGLQVKRTCHLNQFSTFNRFLYPDLRQQLSLVKQLLQDMLKIGALMENLSEGNEIIGSRMIGTGFPHGKHSNPQQDCAHRQ